MGWDTENAMVSKEIRPLLSETYSLWGKQPIRQAVPLTWADAISGKYRRLSQSLPSSFLFTPAVPFAQNALPYTSVLPPSASMKSSHSFTHSLVQQIFT